jgi:hypothetical protein
MREKQGAGGVSEMNNSKDKEDLIDTRKGYEKLWMVTA